MTTDIVDQLKKAPAMERAAADPFTSQQEEQQEPRGPRGGRKASAATRRHQEQRAGRQPFADPEAAAVSTADPFADAPAMPQEVPFTAEHAAKLKVLWDEYEQRQRAQTAPKTQKYRCLATKPDGTLCGAVVEAGTPEGRQRTGELVRCPHGPDAPEFGVLFDRERWPRYHHELTPMEPIA